MVRFGPLPLAAAAAFYGLTTHAAPTVPIGTASLQIPYRVGGAHTGEEVHDLRFGTARPTSPVTVWSEPLSAGTGPIGSVHVIESPAVSSHPVSPSHEPGSLETNREEASEPSVLAMIVAGLGMIGFITARRHQVR